MNPFDLRGPQFLVFYIALIVVVKLALMVWRGRVEATGPASPPDLADPYLIAYLRGGQAEAVRVGVVSLIDRGLLRQVSEDLVVVADASGEERVRRPFERALLHAFRLPTQAWKVLARGVSASLDRVSDGLKEELQRLGLLSAGSHQLAMLGPTLAGAALLVAVSGAKIQVALSRGRHNIGFLIVLTVVGVIVTLCTLTQRRTALGRQALMLAKRRFLGLRARAAELEPGGATNEAVLLAALFGLGALPALSYPYTRHLFPRATEGSASGAGGCGGSGCGGSSGGGGDGGGGGGGCGGGCGGCGG
jgi:uncharacterized protein (TIGR04222 family)